MLKYYRFDYMPRAITEIIQEQEVYSGMEIEKNILIVYPSYMYFLVSPHRPELAQGIESGLEKMITSGDFDRHFYDFIDRQGVFEKLDIEKRKVIALKNPLLQNRPVITTELDWKRFK